MRLPLAVSLESRDGGLSKDCIVKNGLVESRGQDVPPILRKRPGLSDLGLVLSGTAQALSYWNSTVVSVIADSLNVGTLANAAKWNSSDKGSGVALSGGNLITTMTTGSDDCVRCNVSKSTGKWYWEITVTTKTANFAAGIANGSHVTTGALGTGSNSLAIVNATTGATVFNGSTFDSIGAVASADVLGFALDCDARTLKIYLNNTLKTTVTSAFLPSGALYPAVGGNANSGATVFTANFGASSFTYTAPSGYSRILADYSWTSTSSTALNPSTAGLQFSLQDNGSNAPNSQLMLKNASQAWTLTSGGTLSQITDPDYPGTYSVTLTSLTRSGTTATATTPTDTNFQVGSSVVIAGADQSDYNGTKTITGVTASSSTQIGPIAVTIARSGTTATATTVSEPHGFTNGQTVTISGADQPEYNGSFVITFVNATSFSFTVTVSANATTATGSPVIGTWYDNSVSVLNNRGTGSFATFRAYTTSNSFADGDSFTLVQPAQIAGTYTVANRTATSFDFTVSGWSSDLDVSGPIITRSPPTISSITRSVSQGIQIFSITTSAAHKFVTDRYAGTIIISGATEDVFNGMFYVRGTGSTTVNAYYLDANRNALVSDAPATPATGTIAATVNSQNGASFTFTVANSPTTPATGTITATGGRNTVPGIAYLDGYFVVMDVNGVLYNSAEDDPGTWNALEYATALAETGAGKAIARSLNYIVAFKEWSTELWWNAGNEPPGSPLGPVDDGLILVGCASGDSVAPLDGAVFWLSQAKQRGRSVHVIQGRTVQKVSTPDVERVLNADDLATVRALALKVDGHPIYLLTLETSNITLAYDMQSQAWTQWTSYTLNGSSVSVSSITRSGTTATVTTSTAHALSDGDPVKIGGANQSDYNGVFQAFVVSSTVFTIEVANSPTTPATGTITATGYTESYFKFTKYADANGLDVLLHETDGHLYQVSSSTYQDNAIPINRFVRSIRLDGGSDEWKVMALIRVIGDKGTGTPAIRWSDDDSTSFATYRRVDMSNQRPETRRCGKFRRRSIEIRDLSNTGERWEAAETEIQ